MALKLPRFLRSFPIVNNAGAPTLAFHQWWERVLSSLEQAINDITAALAAANIAVGTSKINTSGMTGLTLTATDAGVSCTVTVSGHTRIYGDGNSVSVAGGSITGLIYNRTFYIYYDDPTFAGGVVTYQATSNIATAAQTGARHLVGQITTPNSGGAPIAGAGPRPPGFDFQ